MEAAALAALPSPVTVVELLAELFALPSPVTAVALALLLEEELELEADAEALDEELEELDVDEVPFGLACVLP